MINEYVFYMITLMRLNVLVELKLKVVFAIFYGIKIILVNVKYLNTKETN